MGKKKYVHIDFKMTFEQINQTISKIEVIYPPKEILSILQFKFFDFSFFFIDVWSVVHLLSGGILRFFISNIYVVIGILVLFEIIEYGIFVQLALAQPEGILNMAWDIGMGLLGWAIANKFHKKNNDLIKSFYQILQKM